MNEKKRRFSRSIYYILIIIILKIVSALPLLSLDFNSPQTIDGRLIMSSLFYLAIILFILYKKKALNLIYSPNSLTWKNLFYIVLGVVSVFGVQIMLLTLNNLFFPTSGGNEISSNQENIESLLRTIPVLGFFFYIVFFGPFMEELVFRVIVHKKLFAKFSYFDLFAAAAVFSLSHSPSNIAQFIPYFSLGIVLSYVYYKTDNFFVIYMIHVIKNLIAVTVVLTYFI